MQTLPATRPFHVAPPAEPSWPWFVTSLALALASQGLPAAWLHPKPFEVRGRLYRALGIRAFRRVMTNGDLINRAVRRRHGGYVVNAGEDALGKAMANTLEAERAHFLFLVLAFGAMLYALKIGWTGWAVWHGATNLVCNLWPILLQRYTRGRIMRLSPATVQRALA